MARRDASKREPSPIRQLFPAGSPPLVRDQAKRRALKKLTERERKLAEAQFIHFSQAAMKHFPSKEQLEEEVVKTAYHEAAHAIFAYMAPDTHGLEFVTLAAEGRAGHTNYRRKAACLTCGPAPFVAKVLQVFRSRPKDTQASVWQANIYDAAILLSGPVMQWLRDQSADDELADYIVSQPELRSDIEEAGGFFSPFLREEDEYWPTTCAWVLQAVASTLRHPEVLSAIERVAEGLLDQETLLGSDIASLISETCRIHLARVWESQQQGAADLFEKVSKAWSSGSRPRD